MSGKPKSVTVTMSTDLYDALEQDRGADGPLSTSRAEHVRACIRLWHELDNPKRTLENELDG
jgi:hypothetical protein